MAMNKPVVMIVDDDVEVTKSLSEAINDSGRYTALVANSAFEALDQIKNNRTFLGMGKNKISLVLLDIRMPGMTGSEFLQKLKDEIDSRVDVIIITAFDDDENWADTFFSYDVVSFITKPISRKDLIETIDSYFKGEKDKIRSATLGDFRQRGVFEEIKKVRDERGLKP
jgi:CheY-like chemotaxis protein